MKWQIKVTKFDQLHPAILNLAIVVLCGVVGCDVSKERASTQATLSANNLRIIGLATMQSNAVLQRDKAVEVVGDKPLLSWRVHLLPYIDQQTLFEQFKLDEPWDSEHNKKLLDKMPNIYKAPGSNAAKEFKTNYLRPRSAESGFPDDNYLVNMNRIHDGLDSTIMVMEVSDERAVPWTKPVDYEIDEMNPLAGLMGLRQGKFIALMFDGSVHHLSDSINPESLMALFTRKGKETVDVDSLQAK
jgi:hypothetical protein